MSKVYDNCVVGFFDILGFKNALNDEGRVKSLLDLLQKIKCAESNQFSQKITEKGASTELLITPSITACSDSIVISIPYQKLHPKFGITHAVTEFVNVSAWLSNLLIAYGFLFRGGMSIGKFYHSDGVLFGSAYIDAYKLEQSAKFPRILVSDQLVDEFNAAKTPGVTYEAFLNDCNNDFYLDYLSINLRDRNNQIPEIENHILDGIEANKSNLYHLKKWSWYYQYFKRSLPPSGSSNSIG